MAVSLGPRTQSLVQSIGTLESKCSVAGLIEKSSSSSELVLSKSCAEGPGNAWTEPSREEPQWQSGGSPRLQWQSGGSPRLKRASGTILKSLQSAVRRVSAQASIVNVWRKDNNKTTPLESPPTNDVVDVRPQLQRKPSCLKERRSCPTLGISTNANTMKENRRASFEDAPAEVFESFTPYSKKYGAHPDEFNIDHDGKMELCQPVKDITAVRRGDTIECVVDVDIEYRCKPQITAPFTGEKRRVSLGDEVDVKKRTGKWVQDSIGWLPLMLDGEVAFQVVVPKNTLRYATPKCGVMRMSDNVVESSGVIKE